MTLIQVNDAKTVLVELVNVDAPQETFVVLKLGECGFAANNLDARGDASPDQRD